MEEVNTQRLKEAIRQYGNINVVLEPVAMEPFWAEWSVDGLYAVLIEKVGHDLIGGPSYPNTILAGDLRLYPIMVSPRLASPILTMFDIQACYEDADGASRIAGAIGTLQVEIVDRRANGDLLKITPQYYMPQAIEYLNALTVKLEETRGERFKRLENSLAPDAIVDKAPKRDKENMGDDEYGAICTLKMEGIRVYKIAALFGCSHSRIYQILRNNGFKLGEPVMKNSV